MDTFDKDWATTVVGWIIEDIAEADERFLDRPEFGASTTMNFLAQDMRRLLDAGVPPVGDPVGYLALVTTLEEFYGRASDQLPDDVLGAAATYATAREHTQDLLDLLNPILGTSHTLPPWSFR